MLVNHREMSSPFCFLPHVYVIFIRKHPSRLPWEYTNHSSWHFLSHLLQIKGLIMSHPYSASSLGPHCLQDKIQHLYLEIKNCASTFGWCVISCHFLSTFSVPNILHPHPQTVQDSHCQHTWFYATWHCSLHILASFKMVILNHTPRIQIQKCPVGPRNPFLS